MCVLVSLYILGGLLEFVGLALLAWDVYDSTSQIRAIQNDPHWEDKQPAPRRQSNALIELIATMVAGNVRRRIAGIGLFVLGVIVQTAANIAAL